MISLALGLWCLAMRAEVWGTCRVSGPRWRDSPAVLNSAYCACADGARPVSRCLAMGGRRSCPDACIRFRGFSGSFTRVWMSLDTAPEKPLGCLMRGRIAVYRGVSRSLWPAKPGVLRPTVVQGTWDATGECLPVPWTCKGEGAREGSAYLGA